MMLKIIQIKKHLVFDSHDNHSINDFNFFRTLTNKLK